MTDLVATPYEQPAAMSADARRERNYQAALDLAKAGLHVFPVLVEQDKNGRWRKRPAIKDWQRSSSCDPVSITQFWNRFPDAVAGIALASCRLVVIDTDRHHAEYDGVSAFADLASIRQPLASHPVTQTAGGGEHHFLRQPEGEPLGNRSGALPAGVDVRGAGGFVVAPGSIRPDGAEWRTSNGELDLTDAFRRGAIPPMPAWLVDVIRAQKPAAESVVAPKDRDYAAAALAGCVAELERAAPGNRNNALNALSYRLGRMVGRGWIDEADVVDALTGGAVRCGLVADDGIDAVRDTIHSGLRAGRARPHEDLPTKAALAVSPPIVPVVIWDGDADAEPTAWLVKDMISEGTVGFFVGESRAGKSFLTINLAASLARGATFFGKRTRQGGSLIYAAEAAGTIPRRLKAARLGPIAPFLDEQGRQREDGTEPARLPVAVVPGGLDLLTEGGVRAFVDIALDVSREMERKAGVPLRLIVIDTTLAAFPISNWNDPADVSRVTGAMARVAKETGAAVLGVHHHGKDVSRGPAGSYALTAAADFIVSVLIDGDVEGNVTGRRIAITKQREGETGWGCEFTLTAFKVGTDEHGEDVMSAYVEPIEATAGTGGAKRAKERKKSGSSKAFTDALAAALAAHGKDGRTMDGTNGRVVSAHHVREAFATRYVPDTAPTKMEEARRKAFSRGLQEAIDTGVVARGQDGDVIVVIERT